MITTQRVLYGRSQESARASQKDQTLPKSNIYRQCRTLNDIAHYSKYSHMSEGTFVGCQMFLYKLVTYYLSSSVNDIHVNTKETRKVASVQAAYSGFFETESG